MADISKINPNGTEYDIKDAVARGMVEGSKTATGNPITLTDASESYAEELEVELEPIQNLHGYDKPWVGGAGKNKLPIGFTTPITNNGVTFTPNLDASGNIVSVTLSGTATADITQTIGNTIAETGTSIIASGCPSGGSSSTYYITVYGMATSDSDFGSGSAAFSVGSTKNVYIVVKSGQNVTGKVFYPMIRLSTETDPTFAPYSNICPITGYDSVKVGDVGKNLVEESFTGNIGGTGGIWADASYSMHVARIIQGKTYTITTDDGAGAVYGFYTDKPQIGSTSYDSVRVVSNDKTFTAPISGYIAFRSNLGYGTPQCELGNTATTYEPYKSSSTLTPLGRTVYGGKLNVRTGELVVDKGYKDLGSLTYSSAGTNLFEAAISDMGNNYSYSSNLSEFASDSYHAKYDWAGWNSMSHGEFGCNGNNVRLKNTDYSDATAFKNAMSGRQFVYPIATPITLQLTPQELKLLKEQNTITTNGTTISLKYQPDNVIGEAMGVCEEYTDRHFAWKKVGEYYNGDLVTIDGEWSEILLTTYTSINNGYSMSVVYPFALFGVASLTAFNEANGEIALNSTLLDTKYVRMTGLSGAKMHVYVR